VYKPTYVWPNPAFPFRIYLDTPVLRIFIIENIHHNWLWLSEWHEKFQERDFFIVYCGWHHSEHFLRQDTQIFSCLKLNKNKFFIMFNDDDEMTRYIANGFRGAVINQNCWIDYDGVMRILNDTNKEYNAIYVARHSPFKRHELASLINKLALVTGSFHKNPSSQKLPPHVYKNSMNLTPEEVCFQINKSMCGLILSDVEGACFASSEYLLCGIPVISTYSKGGRDKWYNSYNSIQCSPDPKEIADAVDFFVHNRRDPHEIRESHIALSKIYRERFVNYLRELFYRTGLDLDANNFFSQNYFHKLRKSYKPNFSEIWPN
jgi:glycosyltransferase involved in cell wall biosynthesis